MNSLYIFEQLFVPVIPFLGKNELSFIYLDNDILLIVFILPLFSFLGLFLFGNN